MQNRHAIGTLLCASYFISNPLMAASLAERVTALEQQTQQQPTTQISGVIEVEAMSSGNQSDISLATAEVVLSSQLSPLLETELSLLYEGDSTDVDVAAIHMHTLNKRWSFTAGQVYLPFGSYETGMISDPLTLELAETRETALQLNYQQGDFNTSLYVFKGNNKEDNGQADKADNYGLQIAYTNDLFSLGAGYINDLGDSDNLQQSINDTKGDNNVARHVPGNNLFLKVQLGALTLAAEYVAAGEAFETAEVSYSGRGAKPSASQLELSYDFTLMGKELQLAVGRQQSREAEALELPKTRNMLGLRIGIMDSTSLAFEYSQDTAYDDTENDQLTAQLAVEF